MHRENISLLNYYILYNIRFQDSNKQISRVQEKLYICILAIINCIQFIELGVALYYSFYRNIHLTVSEKDTVYMCHNFWHLSVEFILPPPHCITGL